MKGLIITLAVSILCHCFALAQQTIVSGEYFLDQYVDMGNGLPLEIAPGADLTLNTSINIASLSPGLHQLYVRFKNNEGVWSHTYSRVFFKPPPTVQAEAAGFEYFFDSYQDIGSGTYQELEEGKEIYTISTDGLAPGLHVLFIRTQSSAGKWSLVSQKVFYVPEAQETVNIVRLEYFFTDAEGNSTSTYDFTDFSPAPRLELQGSDFVANTSALNEGSNYTLYVRAFADNGKSSLYSSTNFALQKVTAIQVNSIATTDIDCGETASGTITINASGGEGTLQYSIDGENYSTTNSFEDLSAGTYTVYIKGSVADYVESREVEITAKETPATPVIEIREEEESVLFVNDVEGSFQWYKDGSPIYGATETELVVVERGSYHVRVTSEAGCSATSEPFDVSNVTGLRDNSLSRATLVYPNPANTQLFIELPDHISGQTIQLSMYNLQGAQVAASAFDYTANQAVNIPLPALSEGMYMLFLRSNDFLIVKKIRKKND